MCAAAPSTSPVLSQSLTARSNFPFNWENYNAEWALLAGSCKMHNATLLQKNVQQDRPDGLSRAISSWLFSDRNTEMVRLMLLATA